MLPCEKRELADAFPCWWGGGKGNGSPDLAADLHAVGAVLEGNSSACRRAGIWLPAMYVKKLAVAGP
jgi:hypothetical protein